MDAIKVFLVSILLAMTTPADAQVARAKPMGDPASWVSNDDYPPRALRSLAEGRVGFKLTVNGLGRPVDCTVISTSGNLDLDEGTCQVMMNHSRFRSAVALNGNSSFSEFSSAIRWQLPFPVYVDFDKTFLGVWVRDDNKRPSHVVIQKLLTGPAIEVGIKEGDIILKISDHTVNKSSDVDSIVSAIPVGSSYTVSVSRDGRQMIFRVDARPFPPEASDDREIVKRQMWLAHFGE